MIELSTLEKFCNDLLDATSFQDACPNGVQVAAGDGMVARIATAVTASHAAIEQAAKFDADLLLAHHGYFWLKEPAPLIGVKGRRIAALYQQEISLLVYHLPLDVHPQLGNNFLLGKRLDLQQIQPTEDRDRMIWTGRLDREESPSSMSERIKNAVGREPLHLPGDKQSILRIGWCTGAAHNYLEQAATLDLDAFITGEPSEQSTHLARELGIHFFAAGHHATEQFGVQALGELLANRFDLVHQFIDIPNPV